MASPEADTLTHLEERIQKTVALVTRLRHEKDAALKQLADSELTNELLAEELAGMKSEKTQVRDRLEKLLGHIDQISAA